MISQVSSTSGEPKKVAVFLDRDGVINSSEKPDGTYNPVNKPEDLFVYDQAKDALVRLSKKTDLLAVVVSNQGGIEAGYTTEKDVQAVNEKLKKTIGESGGRIDAIYYCPSNDPANSMRKPNPGMLLKAAEELNIDLDRSYMIGDQTTDIAAGEKADTHVQSILVQTGAGGKDGKENIPPDKVCRDLSEAVDYIIADYQGKK